MDKKKAVIIASAVLLAAGIIAGAWYISANRDARRQAEMLLQGGSYAEAEAAFTVIGDDSKAALCRELLLENKYCRARELLQGGNYDAALEAYSALGEYKDAENLRSASLYLKAAELSENGEGYEAVEILSALRDYPGRETALNAAREKLYQEAEGDCIEFLLDDAVRKYELLGEYKKSPVYLERCLKIQGLLADESRENLVSGRTVFINSYSENAYVTDFAYFVAPQKCDSDTAFFLYYPGGRDEQISVDYFYYYIMNEAPNTVAVFLRSNGINNKREKTAQAIEFMEQIAAERGVFVHDLVLCGSSLGVYPAMQGILDCFDDFGIEVKALLALDAGSDWQELKQCLSREQCRRTAELGTKFLLFESYGVGMNRNPIKTMVHEGNDVTMIACTFDNHEQISYDALGMGVVDWAVRGCKTELPAERYRLFHLDKNSGSPY